PRAIPCPSAAWLPPFLSAVAIEGTPSRRSGRPGAEAAGGRARKSSCSGGISSLKGCAGSCKTYKVPSKTRMSNPSIERVLIVEDEPSTRVGLTELVRTWGFTADSAADGEDALKSVTSFRPSIIITDLVMPRMGGLELLKTLKEDGTACTVGRRPA